MVEPEYNDISAVEAIAFDAGECTPNGWLNGKNLRILPLRDSIMYGYLSSHGNGYRELDTPSALTQELLDSTNKCEQQVLDTTLDTALHFADLNSGGN